MIKGTVKDSINDKWATLNTGKSARKIWAKLNGRHTVRVSAQIIKKRAKYVDSFPYGLL